MLDTKLKKNKLVWAFNFRILRTISVIFLIINIIAFGPKLLELNTIKFDYLFDGDMRAFKDYREDTGEIFSHLLLSSVGIKDSGNGNLTANTIRNREKEMLIVKVDGTSYYYSIFATRTSHETSTFDTKVFNKGTRTLTLPQKAELCYYWDSISQKLVTGEGYDTDDVPCFSGESYEPDSNGLKYYSCVLAILDQDYFQKGFLADYQQDTSYYSFLLTAAFVSLCATVLFSLLSLITLKYGRKARTLVAEKTYYVLPEIKIALTGICIYCILVCYSHMPEPVYNSTYSEVAIRIGVALCAALFLSFVWNDWLINRFKIFKFSISAITYRLIVRFLDKCRWEKKYIILAYGGLIVGAMLSFGSIILSTYNLHVSRFELIVLTGIFLTGIALMVIALYNINLLRREIRAITDTLSQIRNGYTDNKLLLRKKAYLKASEDDVNELEKGIEIAILTKSKADKMQAELITNVAHDLKTPLTSIINYSDLLCEENLPDEAGQYAKSLREKAYRLKTMVQDVFEISKATTGNLNMDMHKLDINKLIMQTTADIDEKIKESTLTFRYSMPEMPVYIYGDGDKLYRVFQNLYINTINYSLENSRVYTSVTTDDEIVYIKIRNTSRQEFEFDKEEILERFVRADKSRSTEGSGLGLSIAKSFTEASNGSFSIETDADMFTVNITFPLIMDDLSETESTEDSVSDNVEYDYEPLDDN